MITAAQRRFYHAAAGAACRYLGIIGSDAQRAYRHQILQEEVGTSDLHQLSQDDLDRVIFRFWLDAADYQAAANVSGNNARRTAYLANDCANQIASLVGLTTGLSPEPYIQAILKQSRLGTIQTGDDWFMDIHPDAVLKVFQILDTHRRRLLRRSEWRGRLDYRPGVRWKQRDSGELEMLSCPAGSDAVPQRIRLVA